MIVDYDGRFFYAICNYEDRLKLKEAGFTFNTLSKRWETPDVETAINFKQEFKNEASNYLSAIEQSMAHFSLSEEIIPSPDGLVFDSHQIAAIHYANARTHTLCADPPGLGKTMVGVGLSNLMRASSVLIVPPAHLKLNWRDEWKKWDTNEHKIGIIGGKQKTWPDDCNVIICNYDMLAKYEKEIRSKTWDLIIADEAHYLANKDSKRSRYFFGAKEIKKKKKIIASAVESMRYEKLLFLTGTPLLSRPVELWPIIHCADPTDLGNNFTDFTSEYCGAYLNKYQARQPFWDVSGATNIDKLQAKLRAKFMIRRDKSSVLKSLPEKRRQLVVLPSDGLDKLVMAEATASQKVQQAMREAIGALFAPSTGDDGFTQTLIERYGSWAGDDYLNEFRKLSPAEKIAFEELSTARRVLAEAKVPMVIEHVNNLIQSDEKVIVFCIHEVVAEKLKEAFPQCAFITGKVSTTKRHNEVKRFQEDEECNVMVANMVAGGTGYTMTAARFVVFAELDWLPSNIEQAEDRAWRRGQKNAVLCQHLVVEGTLDSKFVETLLKKQSISHEILDDSTLDKELIKG